MKKLIIGIGAFLALIVLAAFLIPVIFKDDIRKAIDNALAETVNADFVFDTEDFEVTLFSHFPNPTARLKNFGIINRAPFEGEVLFAVQSFEAVVNLGSLFGDQIKINGIEMKNPKVFLKVLENGTANWDIAISDTTAADVSAEGTPVNYNIGIEHWEIENGEVFYDDLTIPFSMNISGLNHKGSGDFTQDVIDMNTYSFADSVTAVFDGTEYISNKTAEIEMIMKISENYERYDFKENQVRINDFMFSFAGGFKMLPEGYNLDLTFESKDNSFKSLLSLMPGMYQENFEEVEAEGQLKFDGMVKGKYDSLQYPTFDINMAVSDASFKYPDADQSFSEIQMDMNIRNKTNDINNTRLALNNFHLLMGNEPFDGKIIVENLINYPLDAELKGSLNLEGLEKMMPMEGLALKGNLNLDVTASGIYDSIRQIMPKVDGNFSLNNGYIKSSEFPSTLDKFNVEAAVLNTTGNFTDFELSINPFSFLMDGEAFEGKLSIADFSNYQWDLFAKGNIDLEKMSRILEINDMEIKGQLAANINTKGDMKSLEAERYDQLPTTGTIALNNFFYNDSTLGYDIAISEMNASFNPKNMEIRKMEGTIGKSDFQVTGGVDNYIAYALSENAILNGNFDFNSTYLDLNEFMSDDETTPTVETEEEPMSVIEIPKDINLTLNSNIRTALLMDMEMSNVEGTIVAKEGIVSMKNTTFNLLDGNFAVDGSYDPTDIKNPKYDFGLDINNLSIAEAFKEFEIVRNYVPIAEKITGKFSTDFNLNGLLTSEMSPLLTSVNGSGLVEVVQAMLKDSKIIKGLTAVTKLNNTDEVAIKDINIKASIEDGKLVIEPFEFGLLGYASIVSGSTSLDGSIDYLVKMTVPAGQAAQAIHSLTGSGGSNESIILPIHVNGTYNDPSFELETSEMKDQIKDAAKEEAKEEVKEQVKDVIDKAIKDEKIKDAVGGILGNKSDTTKADTTKQEDVKGKLKEAAKDKINSLFPKKGGN